MMRSISLLLATLGPAAAVNAAAAGRFASTPAATSFVSTPAASTQSQAALTTPGPPIIVLDDPIDGNATYTTLTTTFENGDIVTGRFELQTLDLYTNLRQHLTITTKTAYNGTDGTVHAELATGIVMAGGAIWVLLNFAEAAEVFLDVLEEIAEDEARCPALPPRCARFDCLGGPLFFCLAPGALFGCVCEDSCTDAEMFCYECDGEGGKCQTGDYTGCNCTVEKCPVGLNVLTCDDCGNDGDEYGICDGLSHQGYRYKGCECNANEDPDPLTLSDEELKEKVDHQRELYKWDGNFALSSPVVCQKAQNYVPQRASDGPQNVESAVNAFCARYDAVVLRRASAADDPYAFYSVSEELGFWIRTELRGGLALGGDIRSMCRSEERLRGLECARLLKEGMSKCDALVGDTHGHLVKGHCIDYSIIVDRDEAADGRSPPWKRLPESRRWGSCGINAWGITNRYFQHMYPAYCEHSSLDMTLSSEDFRDNIVVPESTEVPRAWADQGDPYNFRFRFKHNTGGDGKGTCYKSCTQAFNTLSKGWCGHRHGVDSDPEYYMAVSGEIDSGCGTWSYEITPKFSLTPPPS